jgi:hypothetical protein
VIQVKLIDKHNRVDVLTTRLGIEKLDSPPNLILFEGDVYTWIRRSVPDSEGYWHYRLEHPFLLSRPAVDGRQ